MAITRMNFRSKVLEKSTAVNVYLPDYSLEEYPVIYLLHGRSDDCNAWLNATSLERYAEFFPFAIVMPQVELSYYTDMIYGDNYWTYLTEELPEKMNDWYHLSHSWEKRFVAGNSMGGYGSFKWALTKPNYFNGAVSFSGALDVVDIWGKDPNRESDFAKIFGTKQQLSASNNNLMKCLEAANLSDNYTHFIQI
ncbi:MAG: esterase family protein, partial [Lactococcus lactis]|nr:esterase family protein [Lactococcus lactis]